MFDLGSGPSSCRPVTCTSSRSTDPGPHVLGPYSVLVPPKTKSRISVKSYTVPRPSLVAEKWSGTILSLSQSHICPSFPTLRRPSLYSTLQWLQHCRSEPTTLTFAFLLVNLFFGCLDEVIPLTTTPVGVSTEWESRTPAGERKRVPSKRGRASTTEVHPVQTLDLNVIPVSTLRRSIRLPCILGSVVLTLKFPSPCVLVTEEGSK